jgi:hypothetical protein
MTNSARDDQVTGRPQNPACPWDVTNKQKRVPTRVKNLSQCELVQNEEVGGIDIGPQQSPTGRERLVLRLDLQFDQSLARSEDLKVESVE